MASVSQKGPWWTSPSEVTVACDDDDDDDDDDDSEDPVWCQQKGLTPICSDLFLGVPQMGGLRDGGFKQI